MSIEIQIFFFDTSINCLVLPNVSIGASRVQISIFQLLKKKGRKFLVINNNCQDHLSVDKLRVKIFVAIAKCFHVSQLSYGFLSFQEEMS